jgi:hypothetical protein
VGDCSRFSLRTTILIVVTPAGQTLSKLYHQG